MDKIPRDAPLGAIDVIEMLRAHGITATQQRVEIARVLLGRDQHYSAEQVLGSLIQANSPVSKATVYNTLGLFARHGLIREVIVDPAKVFYDSNTRHHHHFYNMDTGNLLDIESERVTIGSLPNLPENTVSAGVEVIIRVRNSLA